MYSTKQNLMILSTFLIVIMFVISGVGKIKNFKATSAGLQQRFPKLPAPMNFSPTMAASEGIPGLGLPIQFFQLSIFGVIVLLLLGPMILMANVIPYFKRMAPSLLSKLAQLSSMGLAIFTVLATLLYHLPPVGPDFYATLKNTSITGAFILLYLVHSKQV